MLPYSIIFSRVLNKTNDSKEMSLSESDLFEIYTERLHSVIGNPRVRRLFSSITLDDEIQQIDYELNHSVDEKSDKEFIIEVLTLGMAIEWLQPQVDSRKYTAQMIGGKEEKMLQNNYKPMKDRLDSLERQFSKLLSHYGYLNNSYIRGDS